MESRNVSAGDGVVSAGTSQTGSQSPISVAALEPLPMRAGRLPMREIIRLYMAHYAGRDGTRTQRLAWWVAKIGDIPLDQLSDDHVHAAIEELAQRASRYFAGNDADGKPIHKARGKALSSATLNRYVAALSAVVSWAIRRRVAPKGFTHPCRSIERRAEGDGKTRFLSDEERTRLLQACKASRWPRLYVLVLLALTTGARKGELLGLRWADIELDRAEAHLRSTKNGEERLLPLTSVVVESLRPLKGDATTLLFESKRARGKPFDPDPVYHEALKAAGIRGVVFHTLRHSCASALAQSGATLVEVADLLGHRTLSVTRRYSHLGTQHKRALVDRFFSDVK